MTTEISILAVGLPKPKGSMRHVGNGRMVEQLEGSAPWRQTVAYATRDTMNRTGWPVRYADALHVSVYLAVPKPKAARKRRWPVTRSSGDLDKHLRNILDALGDAGLYADDSQVVSVSALKRHISDGETPNATIIVRSMT